MSVIKNTPNFLKHTGLSFTTIVNEMMNLIPDDGALGIYCYLASKPQNWNICQVELQKRFRKGRDYISKKMKILKKVGAIKIEPFRDEKGKIIHWETTLMNCISTQNTENPYCGEKKLSTSTLLKTQNLDNPDSGKTGTSNKRALVIKEKAKNKRVPIRKKQRISLPVNFKPSPENVDLTVSRGFNPDIVIGKFIHDMRAKGIKREDWQEALTKWILDEKVKKIYTKSTTLTNNIQNESKNPILFWEPGNPDYDRVNGISH